MNRKEAVQQAREWARKAEWTPCLDERGAYWSVTAYKMMAAYAADRVRAELESLAKEYEVGLWKQKWDDTFQDYIRRRLEQLKEEG